MIHFKKSNQHVVYSIYLPCVLHMQRSYTIDYNSIIDYIAIWNLLFFNQTPVHFTLKVGKRCWYCLPVSPSLSSAYGLPYSPTDPCHYVITTPISYQALIVSVYDYNYLCLCLLTGLQVLRFPPLSYISHLMSSSFI